MLALMRGADDCMRSGEQMLTCAAIRVSVDGGRAACVVAASEGLRARACTKRARITHGRPVACYLLPEACGLLPPAACRLPPAACRLPPAACQLPAAAYQLSPVTCHPPPPTTSSSNPTRILPHLRKYAPRVAELARGALSASPPSRARQRRLGF